MFSPDRSQQRPSANHSILSQGCVFGLMVQLPNIDRCGLSTLYGNRRSAELEWRRGPAGPARISCRFQFSGFCAPDQLRGDGLNIELSIAICRNIRLFVTADLPACGKLLPDELQFPHKSAGGIEGCARRLISTISIAHFPACRPCHYYRCSACRSGPVSGIEPRRPDCR